VNLYIRIPGSTRWHLVRLAALGYSIVTRCEARAPQSDPVCVATDPPARDRCVVCDDAADDLELTGDSLEQWQAWFDGASAAGVTDGDA
jgi:hypothetical protein